MEVADDEINSGAPPFVPPSWVSLSPFPLQVHPSPRRLSSHFTPPTRPVRAARQLAWVSLQGRIVGAEEATSAKAIGGGLTPEEAVTWEFFSPMHRILIVAILAAAAANSKKNKLIVQLKNSIEIRDQVLLGMQQKLDSLCEEVNYFKDKPDTTSYDFDVSGCGCRHCDHHQLPAKYIEGDSTTQAVDEDDMMKFKMANDVEQEERRFSDLSDWAPSVSSSIDVQWNTSVEQDIGKLQKECEDKDAIIKELSAFLNSAESLNSKRIAELEDIIRRKNTMITKLRKDMLVLEQKVIQLTRLRRPSSSKSSSSSKKLPAMADNLIYDMDSTTSPSDDSDSSANRKHRTPSMNYINKNEALPSVKNNKKEHPAAILNRQKPSSARCYDVTAKSNEQTMSPLKERSVNQQVGSVGLSKSKGSRSGSGDCKSRYGGTGSSLNKSRVSGSGAHKRWS
ncbi:uncharacterized protein LOC112520931 [Cynara cardunculus var. scolymus]|uniref:uncharacterized protein LOC112520931 n=1 Tax=Cynara cardunculus var. scolymus TaxID=59895 RepID=UPI000D623D65|nr:uncharacterized protein LOC112520931 [Cynara cardunculus var. scolymus]